MGHSLTDHLVTENQLLQSLCSQFLQPLYIALNTIPVALDIMLLALKTLLLTVQPGGVADLGGSGVATLPPPGDGVKYALLVPSLHTRPPLRGNVEEPSRVEDAQKVQNGLGPSRRRRRRRRLILEGPLHGVVLPGHGPVLQRGC